MNPERKKRKECKLNPGSAEVGLFRFLNGGHGSPGSRHSQTAALLTQNFFLAVSAGKLEAGRGQSFTRTSSDWGCSSQWMG